MAKSTKLQKMEHIKKIYYMMCAGYKDSEIMEYAREKWNIRHAQIYSLKKEAHKLALVDATKTLAQYRIEANIRCDACYAALFKQKKYKEAIWVQAQKNKINGLIDSAPVINNYTVISKKAKINMLNLLYGKDNSTK